MPHVTAPEVQPPQRHVGAKQPAVGLGDVGTDAHQRQVEAAGLAGRVEREGEKDETFHVRQRIERLRLRRHPGAEGAAAGEERQVASKLHGIGDSGADGSVGNGRIVRAFRAFLHVRKIVAQRGDATRLKTIGGGGHVLVRHARPCPVGEDEHSLRVLRFLPERGHGRTVR